MKTTWGPLVVLLLGSGLGIAAAQNGSQVTASGRSDQPPPGAAVPSAGSDGVDASSVMLPCTPVAAYWTGPPQSAGMPPGPELAIVSTDVRPKDARLYLDDRFVGRARYLDGRPGYLYLAPGSYHVELRLDGYETVGIDLVAEAGCRFDLKHRLQRVKGTPKEKKADNYGKGKPFNRVYAPPQSAAEKHVAALRGAPDPGLRPELGRTDSGSAEKPVAGAALKLSVIPASASIAIDGNFAATAQELTRMEGPLALPSGSHLIEFSAPGYQSLSRSVDLQEGQVLELSVELTPPGEKSN